VNKTKKREGIKSIKDARSIIHKMEEHLNGKDALAFEIANAFLHVFSYHLHQGDLMPENVLLAAFLRKDNDCD
jgi:hypothetical protein